MPHDGVRRIFAAKGVGFHDGYLEVLVGSVYDDTSSRLMSNKGVNLDELGLCYPGAHAAYHQDCYRYGVDHRAPSYRQCCKLVQARLNVHKLCRSC